MDIDEQLSDYWWERVKYYALLAIERFVSGVESMASFSQPHFHPIAPSRVLGVVFQTKE